MRIPAEQSKMFSMLYLQIQRYFNAHIDKDIDIVVAEVDADIIGVFR